MKTGRPQKSKQDDFALRLRALREEAGFSQRKMAARLGISQPSYLAWESYNVALKPEQIKQIADTLGVTVDALFASEPTATRKRGPTPKLQQQIEQLQRLPKPKQKFVSEFLDTVLLQG